MKKLTVEWKHFDKEGKTCDRCSNTEDNLKTVLKEITPALISKGYEVDFIETKIGEEDMSESNSLFINNVPLEKLLNAEVGENQCFSCSDLVKGDCNCRTVSSGGEIYEAIPPELIREAILNALNESKNLKGNTMNIQVLGSGCPSCKKLFEIIQQIVKEDSIKADVEYITDVSKIIELGIMSSPVLVVDGNPVMVGFTTDTEKIKKAIKTGIMAATTEKTCSCGGNC